LVASGRRAENCLASYDNRAENYFVDLVDHNMNLLVLPHVCPMFQSDVVVSHQIRWWSSTAARKNCLATSDQHAENHFPGAADRNVNLFVKWLRYVSERRRCLPSK
jgi:hypothetical protein